MARNPLIESAIRRRDAAQAEFRRWDEFIRTALELGDGTQAVEKPGRLYDTPRIRKRPEAGALALTEAAAIDEIKRQGRPVGTRQLYDLLVAQNVEIGGKDPVATLSARLSRSTQLENLRPHGWRLRSDIPEGIEPTDPPQSDESVGSLFQPNMPGERPAGGGT